MKMKNYLLPAFVALVMLASCQKDGAQTPTVETGATKSVKVIIENVAPPASRASQTGFTPSGVPIVALTNLKVLFAKADGTVVDTRSLTSQTESPYEYIFHQVPNTATRLAVSNVEVTDLDLLDSTLNGYNVSAYQGVYTTGTPGSLPNIPAWGVNTKWETSDDDTLDGFPLYDAGTITVAPKLARIEIGNIQCLNLNSAAAGANGLLPRFGSLTLANIGIHDTSLSTYSGSKYAYASTEAGLTAWGTDAAGTDPVGWNIDAISGTDVILNSAAEIYSGQVFGFNVVPGENVPNIILEISSATENTNGTIPGDVTGKYFVKTVLLNEMTGEPAALAPIEEFKAGYIYRVDFKFNSENVKQWTEEDEFICVDITVVIPDWVVYPNVLEPGFN